MKWLYLLSSAYFFVGMVLCISPSNAVEDVFLQDAIDRILASGDLSSSNTPGACYTPYFDEVGRNWDRLSAAQQTKLRPFFTRPDHPSSAFYPEGGLPLLYDTRHFRVHYAQKGPYAPPSEDVSPVNGVPDYVEIVAEAFERSFHVQTDPDQLDFRIPPDDRWLTDNGGDERWDVYLFTGPWGGFTAGEYLTEPQGSTSAVYSSYFAINVSYYTWYGAFRGKKAVETTCAHEFLHAIQSTYNIYMYRWAKEATSTWVETRVYPGEELGETDAFDFLEFQMVNWMRYPDKALDTFNGIHEYGTVMFIFYLTEKFGDDVVREIYEEMIPGTFRYLSNLRNIFSRRSTSLGNVFKEFTIWNALTDVRAHLRTTNGPTGRGEDFHYRRATEIPPVAINEEDVHAAYPIKVAYTPQKSPEHMSTKYVRLLPTHPGQAQDLILWVGGNPITSWLDLSLLATFGVSGRGVQVLKIDWDEETVAVEEMIPFYGSQEGQMRIEGFGDPVDEVMIAISNLDTEFDHGFVRYAAGPLPDMEASDLSVRTEGDGTVFLSWNADGEDPIKGFRIIRKNAVAFPLQPEEVYRSLSPENRTGRHLTTDVLTVLPPGQTTYVDSTARMGPLVSEERYHYAVVPFDAYGLGGGPAIAPTIVAPVDTVPPWAELQVNQISAGNLHLRLSASEYLPTRLPLRVITHLPDGDTTSVSLSPKGGTLFASRTWEGTASFSPQIPSGEIRFDVSMEDRGGNVVEGPESVRTGRTFLYTTTEFPPVVVYPNPLKREDRTATFDVGAAAGQTIQVHIYTVAGELVRVLSEEGTVEWDVKNEDGKRVRSGIYFFRVHVDGTTSLGKLAVVD